MIDIDNPDCGTCRCTRCGVFGEGVQVTTDGVHYHDVSGKAVCTLWGAVLGVRLPATGTFVENMNIVKWPDEHWFLCERPRKKRQTPPFWARGWK